MTTFWLLYCLFFLGTCGWGLGSAIKANSQWEVIFYMIMTCWFLFDLSRLRKKAIAEDEAKKAAVESE